MHSVFALTSRIWCIYKMPVQQLHEEGFNRSSTKILSREQEIYIIRINNQEEKSKSIFPNLIDNYFSTTSATAALFCWKCTRHSYKSTMALQWCGMLCVKKDKERHIDACKIDCISNPIWLNETDLLKISTSVKQDCHTMIWHPYTHTERPSTMARSTFKCKLLSSTYHQAINTCERQIFIINIMIMIIYVGMHFPCLVGFGLQTQHKHRCQPPCWLQILRSYTITLIIP